MKSLGQMIQIIDGLRDTKDISQWESSFISSVMEQTDNGRDTHRLTEKQIDIVERIYHKHFSGLS